MALSFPLSTPAAEQAKTVFRANSVVGVSASPFTKGQQVYVHQGEWWEADVSLPPMNRASAEAWVGFLLGLNGRQGTFLLGDILNTAPRGAGTGTPLVNGGSQSGKTLVTDGWTHGITGILKVGDWFQLGSGSSTRLHKVVQDADSDGSGNASLEIWPRLRSAPADNAAITLASPVGLFRLASNVREWSIEAAGLYGLTFSCVEAL